MSHKVISIKDTVYEMELAYRKVGMKMQIGDKTMDFNSDGAKEDLFSKLMMGMMNKPFLMTMSKTGRVLAIKHIDTLYSTMFNTLPTLSDAQKTQFKAQMQKAFGEKSIKGKIQDAFVIYPKMDLSPKTTWVTQTTIETGFASVNTRMTYMLDNVDTDNYLVSGNAVIVSNKTEVPTFKESNGITMRLTDVTGTAAAKLKINRKTGWITETKVTKIITGTVQIKDSPNTPGGLTYPMTITAVLEGGSL
ncbi:hypothetical protein A0256_10345 [Mucilaginibacter sp. PAMC 26640]|nr:hypothetical protein A0256_10345 [Mucilaginibacter sp. PAMC 26640]